jgi:uncharacterized protein (TIGR00255 family)
MIYSMTAFARAQRQGEWGSATCELKSVNHRYLEARVHVPDVLFELEQPINEYLRQQIQRGKVDCYFRFQPSTVADSALEINLPLAKKLAEANQSISQFFDNPTAVNSMSILQWPGVIQVKAMDVQAVQKEIMLLLETAVKDLLATRLREGDKLKDLFLQRLDSMAEQLAKAKLRLPDIIKQQRERITLRFSEAQVEMDPQRLAQEMVMFTQKIDVTEEIDRIDTHLNEVRRVLKQGGLVGRRLDFLMQELNREANTLGSKSVDVDTTQVSMEMKVLIEQLREQMQNIE